MPSYLYQEKYLNIAWRIFSESIESRGEGVECLCTYHCALGLMHSSNCVKHKTLLQLPVFFFLLFFCQPYPGLRNCNSVFLILKISQHDGSRRWVQLFSRCPYKNWYKNWYLRFYKTYNHQIWQAGTSTGFDLNETNQAGAGDVITSRSRDKLKTLYLHYHSVYDHQTWQDGNLPWSTPVRKVTCPCDHVVL